MTNEKEKLFIFETIFNELQSVIFLKDTTNFRFCYVNKACLKMLGKSHERDLLGKSDFDLHPKEIADAFHAKDLEVLESGEPLFIHEELVEKKNDGESIWARTSKIPIKIDGEIKYILGIAEDISHFKSSETSLAAKLDTIKKQQHFLQETINHLPAIFYAKDTKGNFIKVNRQFRSFIGKDSSEIEGKNNFELFPKEVAEHFRSSDLEIIQRKEMLEVEEYAQDHEGKDKIYQSFKFPYIDENNNIYATGGISLDITEKKVLERQSLQNSKLAIIGQMATNIGHELNNPLTIIQALLFKINKRLEKSAPDLLEYFTEDFKAVKKSTVRINKIIQALRVFSRVQSDQETDFNLIDLCYNIMEFVTNIYEADDIDIIFSNKSNKGKIIVRGNKSRLQQAIVNLITNATEAVANSPTKQVILEVDKDFDNFINITVKDTGSGIPNELRDKIFDAFYTTKKVDLGAGIGLSITQQIIENHDGTLTLESSDIDQGSVFLIKIPGKRAK